jgi:hypothetical protein
MRPVNLRVKYRSKAGMNQWFKTSPRHNRQLILRGAVTLMYRCRGLELLVYLQKGGWDTWQLEQEDFTWRGKQCLEPPGEDSKKLRLVQVEHEPGALSNQGMSTHIGKGKQLPRLLGDQG